MTEISFPYNEWDDQKDIRPFRASTRRAFNVVNGAVNIGAVPSDVHPKRDPSIGPVEDEVMALVAVSIEWLRERGVSVARIQSAFNHVKKAEKENPDQQLLLDSWEEINLPADPRNFQPRIDAQGKTVKNF